MRNWPKYARVLDRRLAGKSLPEIAREEGISKQRADQMLIVANEQLAYRVFYGLQRPKWSRLRGSTGRDPDSEEGVVDLVAVAAVVAD